MPAIQANARNFLLNSDYPLDKVILLKTGQVSLGGYPSYQQVVIPHGLPFTPLVTGNWSTFSDFSVAYEFTLGPIANPLRNLFLYATAIRADATNIIIDFTNFGDPAVTLYYRVFGFQPSDSNAVIAPTAVLSDNLTFSSDYNYAKLLLAGKSVVPDGIIVIPHNLGYMPQVLGWYEQAGSVYPITQAVQGPPATRVNGIEVTSSQIILDNTTGGGPSMTYHYRVYLDD